MKYLEISAGKAYFYHADKGMEEIDKITKDDVLHLLEIAVDAESDFEMDNIEDSILDNEAQKIIYRSLYSKFLELLEQKNRFLDEVDSLYQDAIEKYNV